ncbi:MAG: ERF family protein [Ignavibacteriales bacterium]|nr:ERF family protein [Ignavibacteriales bacterium]
MKELIEIQKNLRAPKAHRNEFGGFNYRSAEDILEAVKPLLAEHGCVLTLTDEIVLIGDRYYVRATARISNSEKEIITVSAYAREEAQKKGMDAAQITGAASSYARKYALNGLFCIDDTRDPDGQVPEKTKEDILKQIEDCKTVADLHELWNRMDDKTRQEYKEIVKQRKNQLL